MAIEDVGSVLQSIRADVRSAFEGQSRILKQVRIAHSHSDILLPPDLAQNALSERTRFLRSTIQKAVESQPETSRDILFDIVRRDLLAVECKQFIFELLSDTETSQEQDVQENIRMLFDRFDIVLSLDLEDMVDASLNMNLHEDLLERLTIDSCSLHFSFIESRKDLLTKGLLPTKGKGLTLLRICNELLRRLSKPIRQHTIFAGRILSLLSSVLPSGERSGVNFRGDFNVENKTILEDVNLTNSEEETIEQEARVVEELADVGASSATKSKRTESKESKEERKAAEAKAQREADEILVRSCSDPRFYAMFWSVQKWFSNPSLLFSTLTADQAAEEDDITLPIPPKDPAPEGSKGPLKNFRIITKSILQVFAAVGRREKELSGKATNAERKRGVNDLQVDTKSISDAGLRVTDIKRQKRDGSDVNPIHSESDDGFFPKYLTGYNLFEYEIRDSSFRRHVLIQFFILLQFLLSFTSQNREKMEGWKNKPLFNALNYSNFVLDESDERWIGDTWREVMFILNSIAPDGRSYTDATLLVLTREVNWLRWKTNDCQPIDRPALNEEQIEAFSKALKALSQPLRPYPHELGTAALSRLWEDGVRKPEPQTRKVENSEGFEVEVKTDGLDDLEMGPRISSLEQYASKIAKIEDKLKRRREDLEYDPPQDYVLSASIPIEQRRQETGKIAKEDKDSILADLKQAQSVSAWRAMRLARASNLESLGKMRCEMPDGSSTIGPRIDDVTRLMKAIDDKEKGIPAIPTPASQKEEKEEEKDEQVSNDKIPDGEQSDDKKEVQEGQQKTDSVKDDNEEIEKADITADITADSPEYEPQDQTFATAEVGDFSEESEGRLDDTEMQEEGEDEGEEGAVTTEKSDEAAKQTSVAEGQDVEMEQ